MASTPSGRRKSKQWPSIFPEGIPARPSIAVTRRMMLVGRRYRRMLDQALREVGHSQVRWEVLHAVYIARGESTLMEVAARIGLEGPSIVGTMEKLETGGFIERRDNEADRRSKLIRLTNKGHEAIGAMTVIVDQQREKLLAGIDEKDVDAMLRVLTRMADNLT